jgi:hypothetical protein
MKLMTKLETIIMNRTGCNRETANLVENDILAEVDKEQKDFEYTLIGVMHSVDKWLDGEELEQNEVNRAATMREKTLRIVEGKQAEIERLNKEVDRLSQVVLYHDGQMVDTIKEFAERASDKLQTGNIIMDKSIHDIIDRIENEMLEELK